MLFDCSNEMYCTEKSLAWWWLASQISWNTPKTPQNLLKTYWIYAQYLPEACSILIKDLWNTYLKLTENLLKTYRKTTSNLLPDSKTWTFITKNHRFLVKNHHFLVKNHHCLWKNAHLQMWFLCFCINRALLKALFSSTKQFY